MELSLFTGKGGVGKSTVVAALALEAARVRRRPLIVELGHRASMQAVLGARAIGHEPTEVKPGVFACNINFDASLAGYVRAHVPVAALARRIARSRSLGRFFQAAPAVSEVLTLYRLAELRSAGFDPIYVDLDATGHAIMFLELPRVFEGLVPDGPVRDLLDGFGALLRDHEQTRLHLVTLPGRLPVGETLELHARLEAEHPNLQLGTLFVNRMPASTFSSEVQRKLKAAIDERAGGPIGPELALLVRGQKSIDDAEAELDRLAGTGMPRVVLPDFGAWITPEQLPELGRLTAMLEGLAIR